jgi:cytochrome c oxidase cbb3-type subunit 3
MADMPSEFWSGWILVITITSFLGLVWLVVDVYRNGGQGAATEDEVWDETLREGAKPAPLWWFWFILALMAVSVVYVMLYPGLGNYRGALRWSQGGRIVERYADYDAQFGAQRRQVLSRPLADLAADPATMRSAWRAFNNHCTSCHGRDARGQAGLFPDLGDDTWQWGRDEAQIIESIRSGRQAAMPAWAAVAGTQGVERLADYVLALSSGDAESAAQAEGRALFLQYCVACHGPAGEGNPMLGAPALNDAVWLYGGERAQVVESVAAGRNGTMPPFGARLDDTQIRLIAAWLAAGARMPEIH